VILRGRLTQYRRCADGIRKHAQNDTENRSGSRARPNLHHLYSLNQVVFINRSYKKAILMPNRKIIIIQ
jgi:hypothetical protein